MPQPANASPGDPVGVQEDAHLSPNCVGEQHRKEHDRVLSNFIRPCLLAPSSSLLDDCWKFRSDNPPGLGAQWVDIDFTLPIAPGPIALNDPRHINDLLTAKLFVLGGLSEGGNGWTTTAEGARRSFTSLLDVIRWRVANGIPRMDDLSRSWFEEFVDNVRDRGRWGLLPHRDRVLDYVKKLSDGEEVFPIDNRHGSPRLLANSVARKLGVSMRSQIPPKEWAYVLNAFKGEYPQIYHHTVKHRSGDPLDEGLINSVDGQLTVSQTAEILAPFDRLWTLRKLMQHDPIGFRPFDHHTSCFQLARAIAAKPLERTLVPPPEQMCWLVDSSCRLIMDCETLMRDAHRAVAEAYLLYPDQPGGYQIRERMRVRRREYLNDALSTIVDSIVKKMQKDKGDSAPCVLIPEYKWLRSFARKRQYGIVVRDLLFKILPAACAVVIAALTARRNSEISRLQYDCIFDDENGDPYLSVWIAKTLRRLDSIPIPASVVVAVNILKWLTVTQREATGTPWLFSFADPAAAGQRIRYRMNEGLNMLAAFAGVPPLSDGSTWVWKAHQFRSFFGVTYFWRFDFPSLTALSDFFGHYNPTMTRAYVTRVVKGALTQLMEEKEAAKRSKKRPIDDAISTAIRYADDRVSDFERCQADFLFRVAKSVAEGKETLTGRGGEIWSREIRAIVARASTHVHFSANADIADRTFDSLIAGWIEGKKLEPHPDGHSFCKCGAEESDLSVAACLREKSEHEGFDPAQEAGPDYAYAGDLICSDCSHNIQRARANERYWTSAIADAELVAERGGTAAQRQRAEERGKKLRAHVGRCFGRTN